MADHSCRFNVVAQLSESVMSRILRELQYAGDFPSRWRTRKPMVSAPLDMELGFGYDIALAVPALETESGDASKLAFSVGIQGRLILDSSIGSRPPVGASSHFVPVEFHGSIKTQIPLLVARLGTYGYLELATRELRTVDVDIHYDSDVGGNGPIFDRMIQRIALANLHELASIPISHGFELEITTGWAITNYTTRILDGPAPSDYDDVTIALNTWPNRNRGRRADLHDWVNPTFDFAICYDERLLVQAVAQSLSDDRIPKEYDEHGCPKPGGTVRVEDIAINLNAGYIALLVRATRRGSSFDARGRVALHVEPGHVLRLEVHCEQGAFEFLKGVSHVLMRALLAFADLETFADPVEPDRERACRDRVMPSTLCGTDLSLVLHSPVPRTRVKLAYQIERIDVTPNDMSTLGHFVITHS